MLAFGDVPVGQTQTETVTVKNTGKAPLRVSETTISGENADAFAVVSGSDQTSRAAPFALASGSSPLGFSAASDRAPFTVAPGESRTITVAFTPSVACPRNATLTIKSNASKQSTAVALTGMGVEAGSDAKSETSQKSVTAATPQPPSETEPALDRGGHRSTQPIHPVVSGQESHDQPTQAQPTRTDQDRSEVTGLDLSGVLTGVVRAAEQLIEDLWPL